MKYITHCWDKKYDGILFFIQRLEEMLFHYSDDIIKVPVHNTATLLIEYIKLEKDKSISKVHYDMITKELSLSLQKDLILNHTIGLFKIQRIIESLKTYQKETVHYLHSLISLKNYYEWSKSYLLDIIEKPNAKEEISFGLRAWISSIIWSGYSSQYIYQVLKQRFANEIENPLEQIQTFINLFNLDNKKYRVNFVFTSQAQPYKKLLIKRLHFVFSLETDSYHIKHDDKSFVGYLDVKAIDPYYAVNMAYHLLDIFISFYRVLSNRKKALIGKYATVINTETNEKIELPVFSNGFNTIEPDPSDNLIVQVDKAVLKCQQKPNETIKILGKMIGLHNMALRQTDLSDGFLNLWSLMEVVSVSNINNSQPLDTDKKSINHPSKISSVLKSVLPILQNDYFYKYFYSILDDLKKALSKSDYQNLMQSITQDGDPVFKVMCFVFLEEYEQLREEYFTLLHGYPNLRHKIYKMYILRNAKEKVFNLSVTYAERLKWHFYRLYRVRNAIVHAGEKDKYIQVLGEHLHIYCDSVIHELIIKLSIKDYLMTVENVLLDTQLLITAKQEYFMNPGKMMESDIAYLCKQYFEEIK